MDNFMVVSKKGKLPRKVLGVVLSLSMTLGVVPFGLAPASVALAASPADMVMSSTTDANRYLTTVNSNAFNVVMYNSTFSGVFGDQHMSGIELILHGYRIATNGDLHYLPTPEQWDATPAPSRGTKTFDNATNTITVPMSISPGSPEPTLSYSLVGKPDPNGGVILSVVLRSDVSADLAGKARFNLEFIPSKYREKSYMVDTAGSGTYDDFGVFPFHPQDDMVSTVRPNMPGQAWYVQDWNTDRGNSQPVPFAKGMGFQFAPEDPDNNISIKSDTGQMELFDGRNRAQNGWYVLSELVKGGKNGDTIIQWHILPNVKDGWVREPNVTFSQAGYGTDQEKFAVIELDKWDTSFPTSASLLHVNADGSKDVVYTADLTTPASSADWQRYKYRRFTFTSVNQEGMYVIRYGNQESEIFPIANNVYDRSWQIALDGFLAVQQDHMEVREADRLWHAAPHMETTTVGPQGPKSYFDGVSMPSTLPTDITNKGLTWDSLLPEFNTGGWFDAGDFDLQTGRHNTVIGDLISDAEAFDNMDGLDELSCTWIDNKVGGVTIMHKPDGVPDIVQQIRQGVNWLLANYESLHHFASEEEVRNLRQYTHLGDASTDTDGWEYDWSGTLGLGPSDVAVKDGTVYSGAFDDRFMSLGSGTGNTTWFGTYSSHFAATAYLTHDYYPAFAQRCLNAALEIWDASAPATPGTSEWNTLVNLILATDKFGMTDRFNTLLTRYKTLATSANISASTIGTRFNAVLLIPFMDDSYATLVNNAGNAYAPTTTYANYPLGVQFTTGASWGGTPTILSFGQTPAYIYRLFPNNVNAAALKANVLRAANYVLGIHPVTNNSWLSGFGTKTHTHPYNSNRGDEGFIPGSILPGHITVSPDIVESLDDFSFLWFENESCIDYQPKWIAIGLAASMIANETSGRTFAATKDFANSFMMSVTKTSADDGYLSSPGFDALLFNNTYAGDYGDLKAAGLELVQGGRRIATNGDISLLPTQKQWYANSASVLNSRVIGANSLSAALTIPGDSAGDAAVSYSVKTEPEPGGVKVSVTLDKPLPADLAGKAGFNLEFAPGEYIQKSYQVDSDGDGTYDKFSIFQLSPSSPMQSAQEARTADQPGYIKDYNSAKGSYQPLPLASGKKVTLAAEDDTDRVRVTSDSGNIEIYDGRNVASNGWFVLRTAFAPGATEIVWHISSGLNPGWARQPNVAHNQAGYSPDLPKAAVIELDPNFTAPAQAYVDKLNADGSFTEVFAGSLGAAVPWKGYNYRGFDFSPVKEPGMYAIRYAGTRTELFPIKPGALDKIWQATLSGFLPIQMDHMTVREGYKIWVQDSHRDDALQAPLNVRLYDGWAMDSSSDSGYAANQHINGLNTGGWFDSGNFNLKTDDNMSALQELATAYNEFGIDYDTTYIDWNAKFTELHRNDGVPDIVQQTKQGALQILAQVENVGYVFPGLAVPTLWQNATSGDGSRLTDRRVYDSSLGVNERYGLSSGRADDRLAFAGKKDPAMQFKAAAALAAASAALSVYEPDLSGRCLKAAQNIWNSQASAPIPSDSQAAKTFANAKWNAAVELLIAAGGAGDDYKAYLAAAAQTALAPTADAFGDYGWKAARALKYMDAAFNQLFRTDLSAYLVNLNKELAANPFGVPSTDGLFGGNGEIIGMGVRMGILHKYMPDKVGMDYSLRVVNYILGTHMYNSTSWVSDIGTKSLLLGYGSNRTDRYYIAGGVARGAADIAPDFMEAADNTALLRTENEYTIDAAAKWITLANAVAAFTAPAGIVYSADFNGTASAHVVNNSDSAVTGHATAAVYNESGTLVKLDSAKIQAEAYQKWDYTFGIDLSQYPVDYYDVKVFFWDDDYAPLTTPFIRTLDLSKPRLTSISLDGTPLASFSDTASTYNVALDYDAVAAPVVTAAASGKLKVSVVQAAGIPGSAVITVSSDADPATAVYTVNFTMMPPKLDSLSVDGTPLATFSPTVYEYTVAHDPAKAPTVTAAASGKLSVAVTQAGAVPGDALVKVSSRLDTVTYKVSFTTVLNPNEAIAVRATPADYTNPDDPVWASAQEIAVNKRSTTDASPTMQASGKAKVLWDANYLYARVEVVKNFPLTDAGSQDHLKDSVELFFSEQNFKGSYGSTVANGDQYRVNYLGATSQKTANSGWGGAAKVLSGLPAGQYGYVVTYRVPWVDSTVVKAPGTVFGLDFQINAMENATARTCFAWCDGTDSGYNSSQNWGQLVLSN